MRNVARTLAALAAAMMYGTDLEKGKAQEFMYAGGPYPRGMRPPGLYFRRSPKKRAKFIRRCSFHRGKR